MDPFWGFEASIFDYLLMEQEAESNHSFLIHFWHVIMNRVRFCLYTTIRVSDAKVIIKKYLMQLDYFNVSTDQVQ